MKVHWAPASTLEHCQLEPQLTAHYPEGAASEERKRGEVKLSCAERPPYVDAAAASMTIKMSKYFPSGCSSGFNFALLQYGAHAHTDCTTPLSCIIIDKIGWTFFGRGHEGWTMADETNKVKNSLIASKDSKD